MNSCTTRIIARKLMAFICLTYAALQAKFYVILETLWNLIFNEFNTTCIVSISDGEVPRLREAKEPTSSRQSSHSRTIRMVR